MSAAVNEQQKLSESKDSKQDAQKRSRRPPPPKPKEVQDTKQKVVVSVSMILEAEKSGFVFHDPEPIYRLAEHFADATMLDLEEMTSRPMERDAWGTLVQRMIYLGMAKKFAHALPATENLEGIKVVTHMQRQEVMVPAAFVPILDMYGKIRTSDASYNVVGQPFLCLTYALRALHPTHNTNLGVNLAVNRRTDIFINMASPSTFTHAKAWLAGYVNAWVDSAEPVDVNFGDANAPVMCTMYPPRFVKGATGYMALINPVNPPASVSEALRKYQFLETIPNGAVWTAAQITQAAARGIQVVNWDRDRFTEETGVYGREVQSKLIPVLQRHYDLAYVRTLRETGTMGQLVRRDRPVFGHSPEKVPESEIEDGWMMSGGLNYARMEPERYIVQSEKSVDQMIASYFKSMRKI